VALRYNATKATQLFGLVNSALEVTEIKIIKFRYLLCLLFTSSSCIAQDKQICVNHNNKSLSEAVTLKLTELKFSHSLKINKVCFNKNKLRQHNTEK